MIKLIELSDKLKSLDKDEFTSIYKKSIYNHLRNIYRKERQYEMKIPKYNGISYLDENVIFLEEIFSRLNKTQSQILSLLLNPDKELVDIVFDYFIMKNEEKEQGKLVMNVNQIRIRAIHIATRLNISSAIVSRHMKEIRKITVDILL